MNDPKNPYRLHPAMPVGPHDLSDEEIAGVAGGTSEASVEGLVVMPNANGQMEVLVSGSGFTGLSDEALEGAVEGIDPARVEGGGEGLAISTVVAESPGAGVRGYCRDMKVVEFLAEERAVVQGWGR